ncbi:TVP38/TMEM64 family protein [Bacillus sp. V3B]|uniref:TVP38/TMEM64 family protein n=1 Tax=Bacillus sp. V3B TaxID=2804915 RepID=UPI00210E4D37|nr:VTT domain-containing protein [Bacillus sp. V3B]MCQ6274926.1 TVP38/TMEM64 family protein [Bacillus sp. V3B]
MEDSLLDWIPTNPFLTALISIGLNIIVAITGVLPSTFITVGTVDIFGFKLALSILIIGEAAGAIISFILYRKGVHKLLSKPRINQKENKFLLKLKNADTMTAFFIVILLRIIPFVPSGLVTLTAALSKMRLVAFSTASTIGKIPALVVETYSVSQVLSLQTEWKIGLIFASIILLFFYLLWKRKK